MKAMRQISKAEYNAIPRDYRGVWKTERTDWPDWDDVKDRYLGKRTMLANENGATVLLIEGQSFEITEEK